MSTKGNPKDVQYAAERCEGECQARGYRDAMHARHSGEKGEGARETVGPKEDPTDHDGEKCEYQPKAAPGREYRNAVNAGDRAAMASQAWLIIR